jgi:hypothetical protein
MSWSTLRRRLPAAREASTIGPSLAAFHGNLQDIRPRVLLIERQRRCTGGLAHRPKSGGPGQCFDHGFPQRDVVA